MESGHVEELVNSALFGLTNAQTNDYAHESLN